MTTTWTETLLEPVTLLGRQILAILPNLLATTILFLAGLTIAWVAGQALERFLRAVGVDRACDRLGLSASLLRGGIKSDPSHLIGRTVYWLIFLFASMASLEALHLAPVQQLTHATLAYIPHLIIAAMIGIAGYLISNFVAPYYQRHKYDGTITNSIAYPLTRALYGTRVRQPIGGDFGFSGRLAGHYLDKQVWESDVARFGIDIWMTTEALTSGARVCQSFLGAKIHNPKDPSADLSSMLAEVVGALFGLMETHPASWQSVTGSQPIPIFGFQYETGVEPIHVNVDRMLAVFFQGAQDLEPLWSRILSNETMTGIRELTGQSRSAFHMPDPLWVHIIYDAALACHKELLPKEHLLKALTPLYLGRTASFVLQTQALTTAEAEPHIEALCRTFETLKPYLVTRWT